MLILFLVFSCTERKEAIEEEYPDGSPKLILVKEISGTEETVIGKRQFYEDGIMEYSGEMNDKGERSGKWTYWYPSGKIWSECEYKNGLRHGKNTVYYNTGRIRYQGNFNADKTVGKWQFWEDNGTLVKEVNY